MDKVLIHRSSNVVDTGSQHIALKQIFRKFNSSADPHQERIHVENVHSDGRVFKGKHRCLVLASVLFSRSRYTISAQFL